MLISERSCSDFFLWLPWVFSRLFVGFDTQPSPNNLWMSLNTDGLNGNDTVVPDDGSGPHRFKRNAAIGKGEGKRRRSLTVICRNPSMALGTRKEPGGVLAAGEGRSPDSDFAGACLTGDWRFKHGKAHFSVLRPSAFPFPFHQVNLNAE